MDIGDTAVRGVGVGTGPAGGLNSSDIEKPIMSSSVRTRDGMIERSFDRLVHYSLYLSPDHDHRAMVEQLEASLTSLRRYNQSIPVAVIVHGDGGDRLKPLAHSYRAAVVTRPDYRLQLAEVVPEAAPTLVCYPLLHKFMNFGTLAAINPRQALYIDCDTLFFDDVEILFDRYRDAAHVVAREEPHTRRSPHGYDPGYIDEEALEQLTSSLGLAPIAPFNTGVVLLNELPWARLEPVGRQTVDIGWRFLLGLVDRLGPDATNHYGHSTAVAELGDRLDDLAPGTIGLALPLPSPNHWILDEACLWLALGGVPGLGTADFSPADVLQNGELFAHRVGEVPAVVCHYYSQNTDRLRAWSNGVPVGP
ncbi:MAG: hypothetical protein WBM50_22685 [Acidimicrobiales bacterium]